MKLAAVLLSLICAPTGVTTRDLVVATGEEANRQRMRCGFDAADLDKDLCVTAQKHANWMASTGCFRHSFGRYREVIAVGQRNPKEAVGDWMHSPGHRAALLSGHRFGFGCAAGGGRYYWVGVFE